MDNVVYDKNRPFLAKMIESRRLTRETSDKETRLFVFDIEGSGFKYKPGDSIGIYPSNDKTEVAFILNKLQLDPNHKIQLPRSEKTETIQEALEHHLDIMSLSRKMLEVFYERADYGETKTKLAALLDIAWENHLRAFLSETTLKELVEAFPDLNIEPHDLTHLKRLMPRLYSIACAQNVFPNQIHIAVNIVRYQKSNGNWQKGVTSSFLTERVFLNKPMVPLFTTHSPFKLPEKPETDVILVGPGTGVAPFRAFIQERIHQKASGRNWLFFGDRQRKSDFLFEEEWLDCFQKKQLTRMDLAFSRDQEYKVYVQDRIRENGKEIWTWLKNGAAFYVCGEASRMAKDVEKTLLDIIKKHGDLSQEQAEDFFKYMKKSKQYQKDVY
ncbi:MAG: hypothetical protein A2007_04645 [Verrucomicrobia bacterium GWC2_42_7]|nr:MAG: hypothetical protein A2007_04645 [Verrucomicrobia bacterium GWC2_42_7]